MAEGIPLEEYKKAYGEIVSEEENSIRRIQKGVRGNSVGRGEKRFFSSPGSVRDS